MRRVVVTGGAGFIGSRVVKALVEHGFRVRVVDRKETDQVEGYEYLRGDVGDREFALECLSECDICVHVAGRVGGIGALHSRPAELLDENVRMTAAIYEAARRVGCSRVVYVSSSCVFDGGTSHVAREDEVQHLPCPRGGYQLSKLVGEFYARAYARQYGLEFTIVRPFNVYGPGEMPGEKMGEAHVIPEFAARILDGEYPLRMYGDGEQSRSFTHVDDVARGITTVVVSNKGRNEDFNFGSPLETSIRSLAELLWAICGRAEQFSFRSVGSFEDDVRRRGVDISKARSRLGWEPRVPLQQGLQEVVEWLRQCRGRWRPGKEG